LTAHETKKDPCRSDSVWVFCVRPFSDRQRRRLV